MADGCGGACGSVCFEADGAAKTEERWVYVGAGKGTYTQASSMDYVGANLGEFEKEKVSVGGGVRCRSMCLGLLCFLLLLLIGLLIWIFWPMPVAVGGDDPCDGAVTTYGSLTAIPTAIATTCCGRGFTNLCGIGADVPSPSKVILHDKYYTRVRTEHVPHTVAVPIPGPPAKILTHKVYVKHHPYECTEGYSNWKAMWTPEHQRYCCYKYKEACTTKVEYRNHYRTITSVHHVTVPVKEVVPAPPPREINHIVHVPVHDPSPLIKIPQAGPPHIINKPVLHKHYVPEPVPSPPTYVKKPVPVAVHDPGRVVRVPVPMPAKTIVKNIPIIKTQHVLKTRYYDCDAGFENWHYGWSSPKKDWCCEKEHKGCPGTWNGGGLTHTVVTGETTHVGSVNQVHVIHHVHHYFSHDGSTDNASWVDGSLGDLDSDDASLADIDASDLDTDGSLAGSLSGSSHFWSHGSGSGSSGSSHSHSWSHTSGSTHSFSGSGSHHSHSWSSTVKHLGKHDRDLSDASAFDCEAGKASWKNWPAEKKDHCCSMQPAICA